MGPKSSLPYVDELPIEIGADREATWAALLRVVEASFASARGRGPRLLACEDTEPSGPRPLAKGSAFPGFRRERRAAERARSRRPPPLLHLSIVLPTRGRGQRAHEASRRNARRLPRLEGER